MPQELNGHGPTAGESMGGTGANLNERPDNSTPGGGSQGNAGDRDNGDSSAHTAAYQRQINSIRNDPAIKNMLTDLLKKTRYINSSAKVSLTKLDKDGMLSISVSGIRREQVDTVTDAFNSVKPAIKNEPVTSISSSVDTWTFGTVATGHKLDNYQHSPNGNNNNTDTAAENKVTLGAYSSVLQGEIPSGFWLDNEKVMTQIVTEYEINGGGKGDDRTGYRKSNVEVPSLRKVRISPRCEIIVL